MKVKHEARTLDGDIVEPEHTIEQVCSSCGYDLDESEIAADTCSDCGEPLFLKENVAIVVTTLPPILGRA
jgi:DNA-directed RNA polymerase subunit RPC12/RpoP